MLFTPEELNLYINKDTIKGVIQIGSELCKNIDYYTNILDLKKQYILWTENGEEICNELKDKYKTNVLNVYFTNSNALTLDTLLKWYNKYTYNLLYITYNPLIICYGSGELIFNYMNYALIRLDKNDLQNLDEYLERKCFYRILIKWSEDKTKGEALYIKKPKYNNTIKLLQNKKGYDQIEYIYEKHANNLLNIVRLTNELIEGNIYTSHQSFEKNPTSLPKRKNLYNISRNINYFFEIGFNAGHSVLIFLMANPKGIVYALDVCKYKYTVLCCNYLNTIFNNRVYLVKGDSSLISSINFEEGKTPGLYHIDGSIDENIVKNDLINCYNKGKNNDIVILDDTNIWYINNLWNNLVVENKIVNIPKLFNCDIYCDHNIGKISKN